ncbi:hypothetical protein J3F83DRAFT_754831 [Trichoderma novae-zelandiae]
MSRHSRRSSRSLAPSAPSHASQQSLQSPQSEQSPLPSDETDHVPVDHEDYVYIKSESPAPHAPVPAQVARTEDPCPRGKSYLFKSPLVLDWPCSRPFLIISWDETRGLYFRVQLYLRRPPPNLPFHMYWLPRHVEEVVLSAHDPKQNAHLLDFHFSERPQLFGAKDWIQPLSDDEMNDVKHIYNMCQLNMSFQVAGTPLQLEFLEWIARRVRVHSIASFEQAPRSWYGGAGSVVIQQQHLATPALPLSSWEPRHRSRSQSPVSYSKKRRFPDGDDDASFIAAARPTLDSFPLQDILGFIRDKKYIVFHTTDLRPESGPKRRGSLVHSASEVKQTLVDSVPEVARHSESLVVAAEKKRIEDVAEVEKQRITDLAEVDKQRIEDRAEVDKRRIADTVAAERQKIEDVAAAEMQRIDDCATAKKRRIDDCAAAEKQRINDYAIVEKQRVSDSAPADG